MKKIFNFALAAAAIAALSVACSKEIDNVDENPGENPQEQVKPAGKLITISATLLDTKVSFDPAFDSGHKPTGMAHTWQAGDQLRITDENDPTNTDLFDLVSGEGTDTGVFEGTIADAASYSVEVVPAGTPSEGVAQDQAGDGSTAHLKYVAGATHVTDLKSFTLTETSSIIGFIVKLPAGVTETINQVIIEKSTDNFVSKSTLLINITGTLADANDDNILEVYANIPAGWEIEAGTKMFLRFKSTNANHTVYTRYQEFASAATLNAGEFNYIKMNCVHIDQFAGKDDDGTSAHPYLIADPYQLKAAYDLMLNNTTKYFKMIDDVDMSGMSWSGLNPNDNNSGYTRQANFNGNNKTISNLGANLFYVFKGSVYDLTLDHSNVTNRGILAEYVQGTGHSISNVTITNGTLKSNSSRCGALIGRINSGSSGVTSVTITDCTVYNTNVTGAGQVGGVIGAADAITEVSNCMFYGGTVTSSAQYAGGFVGYTSAVANSFTECRVENAIIDVSATTGDMRAGGFVGLVNFDTNVKGCIVGTSEQHVTVKAGKSDAENTGKVLNTGGFVGVNYGTITKDNSNNNCKAYVTITCANTYGTPLHLGGFVGFARGTISYSDAVSTMTGLAGQHVGGFAGYVTNDDTIIDHCTVQTDVYANNYTGGFAGYVDSGDITISNNEVLSGSNVNGQSAVGGFVGYTKTGTLTNNTAAGTVTVRANNGGGFVGTTDGGTFTDCSSSAAVTCNGYPVGGFVGNGAVANMTRCSSTGAVVKNSANGNHVGGFAGTIETCTLDGCFASGSVTTTGITAEYVGGFIGNLKPATGNTAYIQNCYATGAVNGSGRWTGGFIGYIYRASDNCGNVEISKCHSSGNVAVTGKSYVAAFIGRTYMATGSHLTIEKCYATGNVSSNQSAASAFIGEIGEATNCTITDCYSTGNIIGANQQRGGLIATVNANANTSATISRCYSTSSLSDGSFRLGGLIGNIAGTNCSMDHCAAWNGAVIATSYSYNTNWSSGTIVGTAHPNCTLTDNYRNPNMTTTMWWIPASDYNHPNVEGTTHPLVIRNNSEPYTYTEATVTSLGAPYQFPYHGKVEAGKTLSQLASTTLGWSGDIWDFTGDLPTLK